MTNNESVTLRPGDHLRTPVDIAADNAEGKGMNTSALRQLLRSARYNVTQIDADLAAIAKRCAYTGRLTPDQLYHQGYQNGRKAELESLATTLEMALAVNA